MFRGGSWSAPFALHIVDGMPHRESLIRGDLRSVGLVLGSTSGVLRNAVSGRGLRGEDARQDLVPGAADLCERREPGLEVFMVGHGSGRLLDRASVSLGDEPVSDERDADHDRRDRVDPDTGRVAYLEVGKVFSAMLAVSRTPSTV